MQKKLLGIAVAAVVAAPAVALAQSSVQVYGTVHLSLNNARYSSSTAGVGSIRKWGVTSHASNWGLRSTENLGGGLQAWFQAEFNMKMARDNGVNDGESTARNSGVGLRGGFGNAYLGTWETPWAQTFRLWDVGTVGGWGPTTSIIGRRETTGSAPSANCTNVASAAGGAIGAGPFCGNGSEAAGTPLWRRYGYGVFYESPMFGGAQIKFAMLPNDRKANVGVTQNPSAWSGSLTWTGMGGAARAFIATQRNKDFTITGSTDRGWTAGGGYNFGVVNVGAVLERFTYKTATGDSKARQWGLGLSIPAGPGRVGASYARARDLSGGAFAGDNGAKMWNLGYEWALSKRTAMGFGAARITNDSAAVFNWTGSIPHQDGFSSGSALAGSDVTNLFVSIRHSF